MSDPRSTLSWKRGASMLFVALAAVGVTTTSGRAAGPQGEVTFSRDIAPILQRSCQQCHRPDSIAPMSLINYEQVRPFARAIKLQTSLRHMPPWYMEKNVGIQGFRNDPSLSDDEIAKIATWADGGAPQGNPADMPPPLTFAGRTVWTAGKPDLIVKSPSVTVDANAPDWWGAIGETPTGLTEDRYIASVEILEVNDRPAGQAGEKTVGGLFLFHHANFQLRGPDGLVDPTSRIPAHEVGRNADIFDPAVGRLLKAGSAISFYDNHLHANARQTKAHLELGLKFHPKGYQPKLEYRSVAFGTTEVDLRPNEANQRIDAYTTLQENGKILNFEPHMHATAVRMCFEAIFGGRVETLNCAGYNHGWVRNYQYADDVAPLLPKGTILHIIGWFDTTAKNPLVFEPRNWTGWGNRSVDNMVVNLSYMTPLTDEQFKQEVAKRQEKIRMGQATAVGCPLCGVAEPQAAVVAGR